MTLRKPFINLAGVLTELPAGDQIAGALEVLQQYGLGVSAATADNASLDTFTTSGVYSLGSTGTNNPIGAAGTLFVTRSLTGLTQLFMRGSTTAVNALYFRAYGSTGGWLPWVQIADTTFASNASNLTTGTVPNDRLSGVYSNLQIKTNLAGTPGAPMMSLPNNTSSVSGRHASHVADFRDNSTTGVIAFHSPAISAVTALQFHVKGLTLTTKHVIDFVAQARWNGTTFDFLRLINVGTLLGITVRFARTSDGRCALLVGDTTTSWNTPVVNIARAVISGGDTAITGWYAVPIVTDTSGYSALTTLTEEYITANDPAKLPLTGGTIDGGNTAAPAKVRRSSATAQQVSLALESTDGVTTYTRYLGIDSGVLKVGTASDFSTGSTVALSSNGTYTATCSAGMTTTPTATWKYAINGNAVTVSTADLLGTKDASTGSLTIGTLPAAARPAAAKTVPVYTRADTAYQWGVAVVNTDGTITVSQLPNTGFTANTTNVGVLASSLTFTTD